MRSMLDDESSRPGCVLRLNGDLSAARAAGDQDGLLPPPKSSLTDDVVMVDKLAEVERCRVLAEVVNRRCPETSAQILADGYRIRMFVPGKHLRRDHDRAPEALACGTPRAGRRVRGDARAAQGGTHVKGGRH